MADNHTKEVRSRNMSHIRSKNTKPEEKVRKYLFSKGFRYRKNVRWNVLVVWECQLKTMVFEETMSQLEWDIRKGMKKHE